jgi:hypothetical protein
MVAEYMQDLYVPAHRGYSEVSTAISISPAKEYVGTQEYAMRGTT